MTNSILEEKAERLEGLVRLHHEPHDAEHIIEALRTFGPMREALTRAPKLPVDDGSNSHEQWLKWSAKYGVWYQLYARTALQLIEGSDQGSGVGGEVKSRLK